MSIHCERQGTGPEIVLVHGWGMHGGIWGELPARLAQSFSVTVVDLPGHGRSRTPSAMATLAGLTDALAAIVPPAAVWLGWSLGGLVAMDAALRHPRRVTQLILIASTPRFVAAPDWPHAMTEPVFAEFAGGVMHDYRGGLERFLSLQCRGDEGGRDLLRRLRAELFAHGEPDPAALTAGLAILERTDLRPRLGEIRTPTLVVHGSHDRLALPAAGEYLAARIAGARSITVKGAGHAPFLSQPTHVEQAVRGFLA